MEPGRRQAGKILVVDDTPANLKLLAGELKAAGYDVLAAPDGELALAGARYNLPDLILLDIMMPGMNGFEVCRELKQDPATRDIPVLFISALSETDDKVKAFTNGGVDYITKPFQFDEVHARVQAHLQIKQSRERLEQLNQLKDNLTRMIVHDLRNPLSALSLALQVLGEPPDAALIPPETWASIRVQNNYALEMCEQLLDITKLQQQSLPVAVSTRPIALTIREAADTLRPRAEADGKCINVEAAAADFATDHALLRRVLLNLIHNAVKYTPSQTAVEVRAAVEQGVARVSVRDQGKGIPPEYHERIFELFGTADVRAEARGSGIGLAFCRLAVHALDGLIEVASAPGQGAEFNVSLRGLA